MGIRCSFVGLFISKEKQQMLDSYGWDLEQDGRYIRPDRKDSLSIGEIRKMSPDQLDKRLDYGIPYPLYCFDTTCSICNKDVTVPEEYKEGRSYICPECGAVMDSCKARRRSKMHPFTFQCPHCHTVQRTHHIKMEREVDGFDITRCKCPGCGEKLTFKEESILSYIRRV